MGIYDRGKKGFFCFFKRINAITTGSLLKSAFPKSAVFEVCKILDTYGKEFRNRPLTDSYPFLAFNATYFRARETHRVTARALMFAFATNSKGLRELVGFKAHPMNPLIPRKHL